MGILTDDEVDKYINNRKSGGRYHLGGFEHYGEIDEETGEETKQEEHDIEFTSELVKIEYGEEDLGGVIRESGKKSGTQLPNIQAMAKMDGSDREIVYWFGCMFYDADEDKYSYNNLTNQFMLAFKENLGSISDVPHSKWHTKRIDQYNWEIEYLSGGKETKATKKPTPKKPTKSKEEEIIKKAYKEYKDNGVISDDIEVDELKTMIWIKVSNEITDKNKVYEIVEKLYG